MAACVESLGTAVLGTIHSLARSPLLGFVTSFYTAAVVGNVGFRRSEGTNPLSFAK